MKQGTQENPIPQDAMVRYFEENSDMAKHYRKTGIAFIRPAVAGEEIETHVASGYETKRVADDTNFVICNPTAAQELYVIDGEKINRYEKLTAVEAEKIVRPDALDDRFEPYRAKGEVYGIMHDSKDSSLPGEFWFVTGWGEAMRCQDGDILAQPVGGGEEVYRIAAAEFTQTYGLVK